MLLNCEIYRIDDKEFMKKKDDVKKKIDKIFEIALDKLENSIILT